MRAVRQVAAIGAVLLVLGGCGSDEEAGLDAQAADGPTASETDEDAGSADVEEAPDLEEADEDGPSATEDEPTTADDDAAESGAWPDPIPVDVVGRHPSGITVEVTEVRSPASSVELEVRITNGQDFEIELQDFTTPSRLVDDTGVEYALVPPDDNELLTVEGREVLEGTLSFAGPLSRDATTLTLEFQPDRAEEEQEGEVLSPYLLIEDIPLIDDAAGS